MMKAVIKLLLILLASVYFYSCEKDKLETVTDFDGNVYNTVRIGTQIWMAENLKTTKFNDGADIPLVTDYSEWGNLTSPGYCWYNNDKYTYGGIYGALYNWYTVNTGKLCPEGWHVPSDVEWNVLENYLGGETVAGGKLKEAGTEHWEYPNTGATNVSGFTALPGSGRYQSEMFTEIGFFGNWWSSSQEDQGFPYSVYRNLTYFDGGIYWGGSGISDGLSVRCIKDK